MQDAERLLKEVMIAKITELVNYAKHGNLPMDNLMNSMSVLRLFKTSLKTFSSNWRTGLMQSRDPSDAFTTHRSSFFASVAAISTTVQLYSRPGVTAKATRQHTSCNRSHVNPCS